MVFFIDDVPGGDVVPGHRSGGFGPGGEGETGRRATPLEGRSGVGRFTIEGDRGRDRAGFIGFKLDVGIGDKRVFRNGDIHKTHTDDLIIRAIFGQFEVIIAKFGAA